MAIGAAERTSLRLNVRLPAAATRYAALDISRETRDANDTHGGESVLRAAPPASQYVVKRRVSYVRPILGACHPLYSAAERIVVFARFARKAPARHGRGS